jgi:LPS-assembly lipoprotein
MWWPEHRPQRHRLIRLAFVLAAASLTGGCFEPLYGTHATVGGVPDSVHMKLAAVDVVSIKAPLGSPVERIAVNMRNALQFDLNGGAGVTAPTHRLTVNCGTTQWTVVIDPISGRPDAQVDSVVAYYNLIEIATGRVVVTDTTFAHVDYDIPGREQRFAKQRAQRDAEDRATQVVAEAIRNRLASYFVAGT